MDLYKLLKLELGASEDIVESFKLNGYSNEDDLKTLTEYELKAIIPQVLIRKKFAQALIPWLIRNGCKIEENIALIAGLHPSQTAGASCTESSTRNTDSETTDSVKSFDCALSDIYSSASYTTKSSNSSDLNDIDLFVVEDNEEIDITLRKEDDLTKVQQFQLTEKAVRNEIPIKEHTQHDRNPLWCLLTKGTLESKRIATLPADSNLTSAEIKEVAQIAANYLFSQASLPKRQVTPTTCTFWANNYFATLFPNTGVHRFYFIKREKYTNRSGKTVEKARPTGALYTHLCLLRKKLLINNDTAKLRTVSETSSKVEKDKSSTVTAPQKVSRQSFRPTSQESNIEFCPPAADTESIQSKLQILRTEIHSHASSDLLQLWSDTHLHRIRELKETHGSVYNYLNVYKGLVNPDIGPILIKQDFISMFGATNTNSKLQDFLIANRSEIIKLSKDLSTQLAAEVQRNLIKSFLPLAEEKDDVILQCTGLLLLLPVSLPGVYQINKHWKPSKSNVLNSFISRAGCEADVEEEVEKQRNHLLVIQNKLKWNKKINLQPFVLAVGISWREIVKAHIILDKVVYTFPNILEAVEACFQLFHSFHAEYPLESHNVWEFLQQAVYNIFTEFDWNHRQTSELAARLGISLSPPPRTKLQTVEKNSNK